MALGTNTLYVKDHTRNENTYIYMLTSKHWQASFVILGLLLLMTAMYL